MNIFNPGKTAGVDGSDEAVFKGQMLKIVKVYGNDWERVQREADDFGATVQIVNNSFEFENGEWSVSVPIKPGGEMGLHSDQVIQAKEVAKAGVIPDIDNMRVSKRKLLMGNIIARHKLTVMGASGGLGKSTFCASLVLSAAAGKSLFGVRCHEGPMRVSFFSTEDELEEVRRLVKASAVANDIHTMDIEDRLAVYGQDILPEWFSMITTDLKTRQPEVCRKSIGWLAEVLKTTGTDVAIIDPLFGLTGGYELTPQMMNLIVVELKKMALEVNCAIVLIHHTRKTGAGQATADDLSGGKPLVNGARSTLMFRKLTGEEITTYGLQPDDAKSIRVVHDVKTNIGPDGWRTHYRMEVVSLHDEEDDCDFQMQAAVPWSPPEVTRGMNLTLWPRVVEALDEEPFVFFSPNAQGRSAPKLRDIIQHVCDEAPAEGDVRHDPKTFEKEIRDRKLVAREEMQNPFVKGRDKAIGTVVTDAGRKLLDG